MNEKTQAQRLRRKHKWVFYYDGDCGLCARAVGWLCRLDFFKRVVWIPYQFLERPPAGLSWDDLDAAAYLDTGSGNLHRGFYAFRMLTLKAPLLVPLAPLFWMPGAHLPGVALYRWIARNRSRLSSCRIPGLKSRQPSKPSGQK